MPQMKIWRIRIACRVPTATDIHEQEYTILGACQLQKWLHERACMLHNTYIACLVVSFKRVDIIATRDY
jgi:hypothetical protein